jgi:hypothetical protein
MTEIGSVVWTPALPTYFAEPFDPQALIQAVRRVLGDGPALRQGRAAQ